MIYVVSYNLNPSRDATKIIGVLKSFPTWMHYIDNTWLIQTDESPQDIWGKIVPHLQTTDRVLIVRAQKSFFGWLPPDAWQWMEKANYG